MRKLLNLLRALVAVVRDEREGVPVAWAAAWLILAIVVGIIVQLLAARQSRGPVGSQGPAGPPFCAGV